MKQKLVIFGAGDMAELAHYYFTHDSEYDVIAFAKDADFVDSDTFCGLPVVAFEDLENHYSSSDVHLFIALSYSKLNQIRKDRYNAGKSAGYTMASYISSHATILNEHKIGDNCFILEDNTIQPFVGIGNNVTLWSGNHIGHHSKISDHTFISSHVVISGGVSIGEQCFIGVNATLRDHISIGNKCVVGARALLMKDAGDGEVYIQKATEKSRLSSDRLRKI